MNGDTIQNSKLKTYFSLIFSTNVFFQKLYYIVFLCSNYLFIRQCIFAISLFSFTQRHNVSNLFAIGPVVLWKILQFRQYVFFLEKIKMLKVYDNDDDYGQRTYFDQKC